MKILPFASLIEFLNIFETSFDLWFIKIWANSRSFIWPFSVLFPTISRIWYPGSSRRHFLKISSSWDSEIEPFLLKSVSAKPSAMVTFIWFNIIYTYNICVFNSRAVEYLSNFKSRKMTYKSAWKDQNLSGL